MSERMTDEEMKERFDSTNAARTEQSNVVRHQYRVLNEDEKARMTKFKDLGLAFIQACDEAGQNRELSLAKTNMEQAVMWAVKAITN